MFEIFIISIPIILILVLVIISKAVFGVTDRFAKNVPVESVGEEYEKEKFLKFNSKKIVLFLIISALIPTPVFLLLCGGFKPTFIIIINELYVYPNGFFFLNPIYIVGSLIKWTPYLFVNYIYASIVYKSLSYFYKNRSVNWLSIIIIVLISFFIYFATKNFQGITC